MSAENDAPGRVSEGRTRGAGGADEGRGGSDPGFLTVSNILSLTRIPLGVGFLVFRDPTWLAAIAGAGAVTDLLDGAIARVTRTTSEIGGLLDPFCDRIFVFLGLVSFLPGPGLDWAGLVVLVLRDIFTGGVFLVGRLAGRELPFTSRLGGKVTTALQVLALFTLIFRPELAKIPILLTGIASVYAIIDYGTAGARREATAAA